MNLFSALSCFTRTINHAQKLELGLKILKIEEKRAKERQINSLPKKGEQGFKPHVVLTSAGHEKDKSPVVLTSAECCENHTYKKYHGH